jgi:hypothetical protein
MPRAAVRLRRATLTSASSTTPPLPSSEGSTTGGGAGHAGSGYTEIDDGGGFCDACRARWAAEALTAGGDASPAARLTVCDIALRCGFSAPVGASGETSARRPPGDGAPPAVIFYAHAVVYDATRFVADHPGGRVALITHAGRDCAADFDFHSPAARRVWAEFRIGRLEACDAKESPPRSSCVLA